MLIKISVVIPTYRRPGLLSRCLHALQLQTLSWKNFEIIVVSDGADPETAGIVEQFRRTHVNTFFYALDEKKGPAAARNFGWKKAQAPLVAFTDDDTIPDPDWLLNFSAMYKQESLLAMTGRVKVPVGKQPTDHEKNTAGLEAADFVTANCCCTRRALDKVGGFDERFSMAWREDSDLEFKLIQANIPILYKVDALVIHPVRKAQWGISLKEQKKSMFNALLYKKHPDLYRNKIQKGPRWDYYLMLFALVFFAAGILTGNSYLAGSSILVWAILTTRFILLRLRTTRKDAGHVAEMILTSIAIPLSSIYWRLYGAYTFRVLFF